MFYLFNRYEPATTTSIKRYEHCFDKNIETKTQSEIKLVSYYIQLRLVTDLLNELFKLNDFTILHNLNILSDR